MSTGQAERTAMAVQTVDDGRALQARLQLVVDSLRATILFNPLMAVIAACVLISPHSPFGPVAPVRLALALLIMIACSLLARAAHRAYREIPLENLTRVERNLILMQAVFSAAWGALAFLYWVPENPVNQVYVTMIMGIVAYSVVSVRSVHTPIFVTAVLVQGGIYLVRLATGDTLAAHILGVTSLTYLFYVLMMGVGSRKRVETLVRARFENEDLVARLATMRDEALKKRYEAEIANASKTTFLANMSHELRTPLNAILGFSEVIAQECFGPVGSVRYKEYAGDIHSSGAHLLSLINDLLDVAKIEAGKMDIAPNPLDARRTFELALKLVAAKAREKRQELAIDVEASAPPLYADERALKQLLINLVSNAVKFTPEGGVIGVVASRARDGGFQILVKDNGPGIPRENLDKIFTPFSQVDNRYDRQAGGTGLGLALVRGLAELHGGRAWIESEPGKGCSAFVVLPVKQDTPRRAVA